MDVGVAGVNWYKRHAGQALSPSSTGFLSSRFPFPSPSPGSPSLIRPPPAYRDWRKGVRSYFAVVSRRSKCWEVRELISKVPLFRQTSPTPTRLSDKCASCKLKLKIGRYPSPFFSRDRLNKAREIKYPDITWKLMWTGVVYINLCTLYITERIQLSINLIS